METTNAVTDIYFDEPFDQQKIDEHFEILLQKGAEYLEKLSARKD